MQTMVPPVQEDIEQMADLIGHPVDSILYFIDGSVGVVTSDDLTPEQQTEVIQKVRGQVMHPYIISGTLSERPAARVNGRLYFATDVPMLYQDDGTSWSEVGGGGSRRSISSYLVY